MHRLILVAAMAFAAGAAAQTKDRLQERIAAFQGSVSLCAKNLETGSSVGIRESEKVRTASTIKLFRSRTSST